MAKELDITIEGHEVKIVKFPATKGILFSTKVHKLLGGSIMELARGADGDDGEQMIAFGKALDMIAERNSPEDYLEFIKFTIATGSVIVDKKKLNHIDELEQYEDIDAMVFAMKIVIESVKFNLSGFGKIMSGLMNA